MDCKQLKPLTEYYVKGQTPLGRVRYDGSCKLCRLARTRRHVAAHHAEVLEYKKAYYRRKGHKEFRAWDLARRYNTTQTAYDMQLAAQNGRCAICFRQPAQGERLFAYDHDHETGMTRGVLCNACNGGLGCFRDRLDLLRSALTYLIAWDELHAKKAGNG